MNAEQLQAIKDRVKKATLGPWDFERGIKERGDRRPAVIEYFDYDYGEWFIHGDISNLNDAEFIAHAREDIPQLVAEVERCHVEIADREQSHIDLYNDYQKAKSKFESLVQALHEIYLHADDEDMIIEMIHNALYNEEETKQ